MGGSAYFLCLYFTMPTLIAKFVIGAGGFDILIAYVIWFGALSLWALVDIASGVKIDKATG